MRLATHGADHPEVASASVDVCRVLLGLEEFARAEALLHPVLALFEKHQPGRSATFEAQGLLGRALLGQKKYAEAEPLLRQCYEGLASRQTTQPSRRRARLIHDALQRLVQLYEAWEKPAEVAQWRQRLAEFDKAVAAEQSHDEAKTDE
jgi:hypothetical protein